MKSGSCEYCSRPGRKISNETDTEDVFVCNSCMKLLKSPETALPLIRGHLSILGRDKGKDYKKQLEKFMSMISEWHKRN